eukprot:Amastigsp_a527511_2.p2 type:complete len:174 gc:universal Amastigsp_a527511_2:574-53(-)
MWTQGRNCHAHCLTRWSRPRTSRPACRPCVRSSFRCLICAYTAALTLRAARQHSMCSNRCATKSPCCARRHGTASPIALVIFLPAVMPLATTAINGQKCCLPMPTACLKSWAYCLLKREAALRMRYWHKAVHVRPWSPSWHLEVANLAWTPCSDTTACPVKPPTARHALAVGV